MTNLWVVLILFSLLLVLVHLKCLLLLQSVNFQQIEMGLDWSMLSFSQEEKSGIEIVNSGTFPFLSVSVVWNFILVVSLAADDQEDVLEVLSVHILILSQLEEGVEIIKLLVLVQR